MKKNSKPKSRIIKPNFENNIDINSNKRRNQIDKNLDPKINKVVDEVDKIEKTEDQIIIENENTDLKIINQKDAKNEALQKEKKIKIFYLPDSSDIDDETLKKIYLNIRRIDKNNKITLRSYSSKSQERTTSFARRLSLTRALKVRNILLEEGFSNTKVFVRALGAENSNQENQDILIFDIE